MIEIKFNEDVRNFKAGSTARIETKLGITWVVGKNGCGKSTFLKILRSRNDALKEHNLKTHDGLTPVELDTLGRVDVEISGLEKYSKCFYLDAVLDNPVSFENSGSAGALMGGGGIEYMRISRGQGSTMMLAKFVQMVKRIVTADLASKSVDEADDVRNLIVLDEIDEGLDYKAQVDVVMTLKIMSLMMNADIIVVTHSVLPIFADKDPDVYDFAEGKYVNAAEYFSKIVKKTITISDNEPNNEV